VISDYVRCYYHFRISKRCSAHTHALTHAREKRQQVSKTVSSSLSFVCVTPVSVAAVYSIEWVREIDSFLWFPGNSFDCRGSLVSGPETLRQPPLHARCRAAVRLRSTTTRRYPSEIDVRSTIRTGPSYHRSINRLDSILFRLGPRLWRREPSSTSVRD